MAGLTYKFTGVNTTQLANEVQRLRRNSSTFQALEAAAAAAGYTTIEIKMGAGLLPGDIANSTKTNSSTRTILINSDAVVVKRRLVKLSHTSWHMPSFLHSMSAAERLTLKREILRECGCGARLGKWRLISDCPEQTTRTTR